MTKQILQECVKLFKKAKELREELKDANHFITKSKPLHELIKKHTDKIIYIEKEHQKIIGALAKDNMLMLLDDILEKFKNADEDIAIEAFFILVESRKKKYILEVINSITQNNDYSFIKNYLGYLSNEAVYELFYVLKEQGFSKTFRHELLLSDILDSLRPREGSSQYVKEFQNINEYSGDVQMDILNFLEYFKEAKEIILKAYRDNLPFAVVEDVYVSANSSALLLEQSPLAFDLLRDKKNICFEQGVIINLIEFGDKSDGELIAKALIECIKEECYKDIYEDARDWWLYLKIKEMDFISNPTLLEKLTDIFLFTNFENIVNYHNMLTIQFGCNEECQKLIDKINIIEDDNIPKSLREELKEFWDKHPKNDQRRKNLATTELYDIYFSTLHKLVGGVYKSNSSLNFSRLLITTGERFPLRENGYFFNLKEDVDRWLEYLEKNKEKYEPGRWIRYGKYVD